MHNLIYRRSMRMFRSTEEEETHVFVTGSAKNVHLVRNPGYEVGPASSKSRVLRVVGYEIVLETKIGIHADDSRI